MQCSKQYKKAPRRSSDGGLLIDLAGGNISWWNQSTITLFAPFVNCPYQQCGRTRFVEIANQWPVVGDKFKYSECRIDDVHNTKEYRENEYREWCRFGCLHARSFRMRCEQ